MQIRNEGLFLCIQLRYGIKNSIVSGLFIVFNRRVRLNVNIAINFISMVLGVVHEVDLNLNSFKKPRFQVFRLV